MKVRVVDVKEENTKNITTFSTDFGIAQAIWEGEAPLIEKEYFVELEIAGVLKWEKDIVKSGNSQPIIETRDDITYINGCLESIDDDGYTVIRIGESIICLEAEGDAYPIGTFVEIQINSITLYNVDA